MLAIQEENREISFYGAKVVTSLLLRATLDKSTINNKITPSGWKATLLTLSFYNYLKNRNIDILSISYRKKKRQVGYYSFLEVKKRSFLSKTPAVTDLRRSFSKTKENHFLKTQNLTRAFHYVGRINKSSVLESKP